MDLLQNCIALQTALEELVGIARGKKTGDFVHSRIQAMTVLLNLFLDEDMSITWRKASVITAKTQGHGKTRAWTLQQWVLTYVCTWDLPLHQMGWKCTTALENEEISQEIQFALVERAKNGHSLNATILIEVVSSPEIQAQFLHLGIDKPFISECTAHCWLEKLGWQYGRQRNGMYINGHEHEDVVESHNDQQWLT